MPAFLKKKVFPPTFIFCLCDKIYSFNYITERWKGYNYSTAFLKTGYMAFRRTTRVHVFIINILQWFTLANRNFNCWLFWIQVQLFLAIKRFKKQQDCLSWPQIFIYVIMWQFWCSVSCMSMYIHHSVAISDKNHWSLSIAEERVPNESPPETIFTIASLQNHTQRSRYKMFVLIIHTIRFLSCPFFCLLFRFFA